MYFDFLGYKIPLEYIKEKSCYNNNYYRLPKYYNEGDYNVYFNKDNILLEECDEDYNYFTYKIGHFEYNEFVANVEFDIEGKIDTSDGLIKGELAMDYDHEEAEKMQKYDDNETEKRVQEIVEIIKKYGLGIGELAEDYLDYEDIARVLEKNFKDRTIRQIGIEIGENDYLQSSNQEIIADFMNRYKVFGDHQVDEDCQDFEEMCDNIYEEAYPEAIFNILSMIDTLPLGKEKTIDIFNEINVTLEHL